MPASSSNGPTCAACSGSRAIPTRRACCGSMPRACRQRPARCRPSPARCRARSTRPPGCPFAGRCPRALGRCRETSRRSTGRRRPRLRLLEPRPVSGRPDPILEVQDLVKHFPVKGGGGSMPSNGVSFCPGTRRDHRHRRRIRLRQVDARAHRAAPDRADQRQAPVRRRGPAASAAERPAPTPARHADHLSGPLRLARSARADRREHRGAAAHPRLRQPGRARARAWPSCSSWSGSVRTPPRAIRTSSRAASASASASPARSPPGPSS